MALRKFAIGDQVRLNLDSSADHRPYEAHTISRMLPAQNNVWQYRVKRVADGQERAVNEVQLTKLTPEERAGRPPIDMQPDFDRARNASAAHRIRGSRAT